MRTRLIASLAAATLMGLGTPALAGPVVGVVAPMGDASFAALGEQLREGVAAYQQAAGHPFDRIVEAPETCDAASGRAAARSMVSAKVDAIIGFLCPESLDAALPILSKAHIVTIPTSVRAGIVMEEAVTDGWPAFRLAPSRDAEIDKIVDVIAHRWSGAPFALVEDGTIYGRELTENVRVALESLGIKAAFIDTYRPAQDKQFGLAHRLKRAGVTHVFVGGERDDIAVIARDCGKLGLDLTFMGGDALKAAPGDVPLTEGVYGVMTPAPQTLPSAAEAVAALRAQHLEPYGEHIAGYAAGRLVAAAAASAEADGTSLASALAHGTFHTALGTIRFTDKHERADNPFELMVWRDDHFFPVEEGGTGLGE